MAGPIVPALVTWLSRLQVLQVLRRLQILAVTTTRGPIVGADRPATRLAELVRTLVLHLLKSDLAATRTAHLIRAWFAGRLRRNRQVIGGRLGVRT